MTSVLIDQAPIGDLRDQPRDDTSRPMTRFGVFSPTPRQAGQRRIRRVRSRSNVPGGRCENCEGAGYIEVEMVFMADVFVAMRRVWRDDDSGPDVLEVTVKNKNIAQVLDLTVEEAVQFFHGPGSS